MSMTLDEFDLLFPKLRDGGVDSETYQRLSGTALEVPGAARLATLDPFSPAYKAAAMKLYYELRGDAERGYLPTRDENSGVGSPANVWTDLPPWSFRDPKFAAEFFYSWGHILSLLDLPANSTARVLEYGPGAGQILLFLARMGIRAFGVDVDPAYVALIRRQAAAMDLPVEMEEGTFGEGFDGQVFDRILFYEAFHHAADFLQLLTRLRQRLAPGGRLLLIGEPVVGHAIPVVPFPWGPRLDALSVFCIRHHGWLELGFTQPFLLEALQRSGYRVSVHHFTGCGRADAYVAEPAEDVGEIRRSTFGAPVEAPTALQAERDALQRQASELMAQRDALLRSTSWRITWPLRAAVSWYRRHSPR